MIKEDEGKDVYIKTTLKELILYCLFLAVLSTGKNEFYFSIIYYKPNANLTLV